MSEITNCPNCQTQFIVTEEQLSQYNGKVRCGHCLQVFNAKDQLISAHKAIETDVISASQTVETQAELELHTQDNVDAKRIASEPLTFAYGTDAEATTSPQELIVQQTESAIDLKVNHAPVNAAESKTLAFEKPPKYFDDAMDKSKLQDGDVIKPRAWLLIMLVLALTVIAIAQSLYFLRSSIAIYYPNIKPYLVQACEKLECSITLPSKIEFMMIDDSDMQEDADHAELMHLTSSLINQAKFSQSYPNLELTLTDVDDKPKLRRTFKPAEYLPENTDIASGIAAGEEVKIKLALTTQGETVAGYRVFVTY